MTFSCTQHVVIMNTLHANKTIVILNTLSCRTHIVMLNLFQHLSINREIPKQVRNDMGVGTEIVVRVHGVRNETVEKEVQDTSCRGSGGVPQHQKKSPKIGG